MAVVRLTSVCGLKSAQSALGVSRSASIAVRAAGRASAGPGASEAARAPLTAASSTSAWAPDSLPPATPSRSRKTTAGATSTSSMAMAPRDAARLLRACSPLKTLRNS